MENIPGDKNPQTLERIFKLPDGEGIEQSLSRMLMRAIASVENMGPAEGADKMGSAGRSMPDDDRIWIHRLEVQHRILQALSFNDRAGKPNKIDDVGAQSFGRHFKRAPRPGARLEEKVDDCFASEYGNLFDFPSGNFVHRIGCVQDGENIRIGEILNSEEMFMSKRQQSSPILFRAVL